MRWSVVVSAVVAVIVGFGGALAVILSAAQAVGATAAETSSWVSALCLAMAVTTPYLSIRHRLPIVTAWSTPGAALIAASTGISLSAAVGAFLLAGALVLLTALFRPLAAWIERLPISVAAAMLAGVLIRFVIAVFESAHAEPGLVLPLVGLFLVMRLVSPFGAVLIVLVVGVMLAQLLGLNGEMPGITISSLTFITPTFDPAVLIGLGIPLYLVTMASQNLPGFAVLKAAGYPVPSRSILAVTGLASMATAPFGAHASNLAAITASICTGPDAHPDKDKRWLTGPIYGASYLVLAIFGASLVTLFHALPQALIVTIAGTALTGALSGALGSAMADEKDRVAATLTLAVTASGVSFLGIGSAFWGLAVGLVVLGLGRLRAAMLVPLLLVFAGTAEAEWRIPDPWPDTAGISGVEVTFPSTSPFTPADIGDAAATAAIGRLFLPVDSAALPPRSVPAVILLHGSGGVLYARELTYGAQLASMGIAALVIDSFAARRDRATGFTERLLEITETMALADAYAGLAFLAQRPEIDPARVVLTGFSYGGMSTMYALSATITERLAPTGLRFAGHVAFYGPCIARFEDKRTTGAPLLMMWGGGDELIDAARCNEVAQDMRNGGSTVETIVYPGAVHQWDGGTPLRPIGRLLNDCRFIVESDGTVRDDRTGLPMSGPLLRKISLFLCVENKPYMIGADPAVRVRSNQDFGRFLARVFARP